jgi:hypothetical protein
MHIMLFQRLLAFAGLLLVATRAVADPMPCPLPQGVDPEHVVPVIRSASFVQSVDGASPGFLATRAIAGDLVAVYVEDRPSALAYFRIPEGDRACWSGLQTQRAALHNMIRAVPSYRYGASKKPGVTLVTAGGNYEPTFILAFRVLTRVLETPLDAYVVGVPNHDMLLVADPRDPAAVQGMQELVDASYGRGTKPLSPHLFVVTKCDVVMVEPAAAGDVRPCR